MIAKRSALAALLFAAFGAYLLFGTAPRPMRGQPVPDNVAAEVRGGICQNVGINLCPGYGSYCPSSTYVCSCGFYGSGWGSSYCSATCGEFFAGFTACAG